MRAVEPLIRETLGEQMVMRRKRYAAGILCAGALAIGAALLLVLRFAWRPDSSSPVGSDDAGPARAGGPELRPCPSETGAAPEQQVEALIRQYTSLADRDLAIAELRAALDRYPEHADTITRAVRVMCLLKEFDAMPGDSDETQRIWRELEKAVKSRDSEYELKGDFWLQGEMERMLKERGDWSPRLDQPSDGSGRGR
ncbi:MAG: hypothetical protein ACYS9X_23675 [Planctomycetota bacterium]|jgi:hypothetical protein